MKNLQANIDILRHIYRYCDNIEILINRFGNDFNIFEKDLAFRDSVSMNIFQIGELANHLTTEFRTQTNREIPWKNVRAMRNRFAHGYGAMSLKIIWSTAISDIPPLKIFCERQIKMNELYNQEALEPEYEDELDDEI